MLKHLITFLLIFSCLIITSTVKSQSTFQGKQIQKGVWNGKEVEYMAGEILFKLKLGISLQNILPILNNKGIEVVEQPDVLGIAFGTCAEDIDIISLAKEISSDPAFDFFEPNFIGRAGVEPNDTDFNKQWGLKNIGQTPPGGTIDADIDAPEAWDINKGSSSVIIAILDSGIPMQNGSLSHPDLDDPNKIIIGYDAIGDGNGVKDEYGHGTHVAGIIGAETNNALGVAGVCWNNKLLIIQAFNAGGYLTFKAFKDGVIYAVDHGAKVINYSGGGDADSSNTMKSAIIYAKNNNRLIVTIAGNKHGGSVIFPGAYSTSYDNVITVSATDHNDNFASYSSKGSSVNVSAPGGYGGAFDANDVFSTTPNYSFRLESSTTRNYGYMAGTSMSAPHVSGLAGLIYAKDAAIELKPVEVRTIIEQTADDKGSSGRDNYYGWGRINAYNAIRITTSGTLPGNEVWRGNLTITGNITVPSGVKLTILPGTIIKFNSGKKLTINGTLSAQGPPSSPITFQSTSGTWYGIEFTNASYNSMIQYCTIKNATVGVHMNNTHVYLGSNVIQNNTIGMLFNSGSDGVSNNNEIIFNSSCGIKCTSNSDPLLFSWNVIRDNGYGYGGVYGDASSVFDLGRYSDQGHNSIYYNDQFDVSTDYSGTIYARYNWWGDSDPDPNLDYTPPGYIDWSYYLTSDPNTMLAKTVSDQLQHDSPIIKTAASIDTIGMSEVDYAYLIYRKEAYQTAASLFETIVHKYPTYFSGRRALAFLYKCNNYLDKASDNIVLLDNVSATYANQEIDALAKNIAAGELTKQGDYQTAIVRSEAVTNSFAKTAYSKQALFNLGSIYWYFLNEPKTGEIYYRQLIAAYPDDDLSISALATLGEWKPDEPQPDQPSLAANLEPTKFSLDQNYPNPFNPETTIRYQLAEASLVTIKIFNLLGEEVVTLIDGIQLQGNHAIQWNGRDRFGNTVANGVYWLRLQAGKLVGQRKLVVVR